MSEQVLASVSPLYICVYNGLQDVYRGSTVKKINKKIMTKKINEEYHFILTLIINMRGEEKRAPDFSYENNNFIVNLSSIHSRLHLKSIKYQYYNKKFIKHINYVHHQLLGHLNDDKAITYDNIQNNIRQQLCRQLVLQIDAKENLQETHLI